MYGKPDYLPVDENHPIKPVDINGINKISGEWYHLVYNNVYGIRTTVLRLTNTYGPRMRVKDARQTFLGIWIRKIIENQTFFVFGDGQQIRDYNYIDDVVTAFLLSGMTDSANGEIFNLGADDPTNLKNTAKLLVQCNHGGSYELVPFPPEREVIDIGDYYGDYRKIYSKLGWKPSVSLEEGLRKTMSYYKKHFREYW
jgi:nucleoside-diphosphate-sugar epimerase